MKVLATDDLPTVGFKVCTVLDESGVTAVLTGGSAATFYAPAAYQSGDLDFVLQFTPVPPGDAEAGLIGLGYSRVGGEYVHGENPLTLDFPPGPIVIGASFVTSWDTQSREGMILHILTPTDCCLDRLAHFVHWHDRSALMQAVAVGSGHEIDENRIRRWFQDEGYPAKFGEFERELRRDG